MCQKTSQRTKVRVATEDIKVWKTIYPFTNVSGKKVSSKCRPINYHHFVYRKGIKHRGKYQGRSFYDRIRYLSNTTVTGYVDLNGEGFHSFEYINDALKSKASLGGNTEVGRFTIPKGASYIDGIDGRGRATIVSTQLRFDGFKK